MQVLQRYHVIMADVDINRDGLLIAASDGMKGGRAPQFPIR